MATKKYIILRKDLFPTEKKLEETLNRYKEEGLNVEEEISKLIDLGYIKES